MKHSPYRSFRDWILSLFHAGQSPLPKPFGEDSASLPVPADSEFVPTVPWRIVFAAGARTAIEVVCPYCDSSHQHLIPEGFANEHERKKARGKRERDIVFEAPCGWGKYRMSTLGQHEDSAGQEV